MSPVDFKKMASQTANLHNVIGHVEYPEDVRLLYLSNISIPLITYTEDHLIVNEYSSIKEKKRL